MKKNLFPALGLALSVIFTGCKKDEVESTLNVDKTTESVTAAGGTVEWKVTSNTTWSAATTDTWLHITPEQGTNNGTVTVTVDPQAEKSSRTGTVRVQAGTLFKTLTIAQSAPQVVEGVLGDGTNAFEISADTRLTYPNTYTLKGFVYVTSGATLTIEPGVIIKGDKATKGTLIIEPGAKIMADGTQELPIVFTSANAKGARKNGDWGGVIICGKAPNNNGTQKIEGGPRTVHGGNDVADNSGVFRYVRIEFAGIPLDSETSNSEINGLTMGSVGTGTQMDHIQVSYSGDDSFEWFGGTVDAKNLVAYSAWDDDFDADYGWSGHVQFGLAVRNPLMADQSGSNGFESDNNATGAEATPYTTPIFSNISVFGPVAAPADYTERGGQLGTTTGNPARYSAAAHLRRRTRLNLFNSVLTAFPVGLIIEANSQPYAGNQLNIQNVVLAGMIKNFQDTQASASSINGNNGIPEADAWTSSYFRGIASNKTFASVADLKLSATPGMDTPVAVPTEGSPLLGAASWSHANLQSAYFDKSVTYIGAFGPTETATNNWTSGWTNFDPQNTDY